MALEKFKKWIEGMDDDGRQNAIDNMLNQKITSKAKHERELSKLNEEIEELKKIRPHTSFFLSKKR